MPENDWFKDAQDKGAVQWVSDKEIRKAKVARSCAWIVGIAMAVFTFLGYEGDVGPFYGKTWGGVIFLSVMFGLVAAGLVYAMIAGE